MVGSAAISSAKIIDDDTYPADGLFFFFDAWFPAVTEIAELGSVTVMKSDEGSMVLNKNPAHLPIIYFCLSPKAEALFHHTHPYGFAGPLTPEPMLILEIGPIPEPSAVALLLPACLALAMRRRRK